MDIAALREQHDDIGLIVAQLRRAIADPDQPQAVSAARWQLARKVMAHLALEDGILYPALQRVPDERVRTNAARLQIEIGTLAESFARYMSSWSDERITREWPIFRAETKQVLDALSHRIDRENSLLYPLAAAIPQADRLPKAG